MWAALGFYRLSPERRERPAWIMITWDNSSPMGEIPILDRFLDFIVDISNFFPHLYFWGGLLSMKCVTGVQSSGGTDNKQTISSKNSLTRPER